MPVIFKQISYSTITILAVCIVFATSAAAATTGGIGGRPAHPDPANPRTQSIFIFQADKGEQRRDAVLVSNNGTDRKTIELYAVDGIVTNTGAYTCSQESEPRVGVGQWISLEKMQVTLEPGKTEEVPFTVSTPDTADVGEHNGCIVFQSSVDTGEQRGNVRIRTRQAIRVVATVPGELRRNIMITKFSTARDNRGQMFQLDLKNSGNVSADVDTKVTLTSMFGRTIYENGGGYPVLSNQMLQLTFVDEKRPLFGGWYVARAQITYDKRPIVLGPGDTKFLTTRTAVPKRLFIAPTALGIVLIVLFIVSLFAVTRIYIARRRLRRELLQSSISYSVKRGESIQSIAERHSVSWKAIASLNKIRPPYNLQKGDTIRIPRRHTSPVVTINHKRAKK